MHSVQVVAAAQMAAAKATVTSGTAVVGVSPMAGAYAVPSVHASVRIDTPVASTAAGTATARPVTKGCLGCLVKKPTTPAAGRTSDGLLQARWYQPMTNNHATDGPRFDTGLEVVAWGVAGANVATGTAVKILTGAAALATGLAGVAAGAAALAM